ncbi:MAG TPA: hypothetical protein VMU70_02620, partial [Candidatus Tyrphobacter sp.]|nr:hypothetical protein [Candidatus Tyrphobacter sp.]
YEAWRRKPGSLDSRFCETILKLLYPTSYSERRESWRKSTFEEIWLGLPRIIGDALAPPLIKDDRGEFVSQLPEGVKQSLGAVVAHVPQMVGLVVDWMR